MPEKNTPIVLAMNKKTALPTTSAKSLGTNLGENFIDKNTLPKERERMVTESTSEIKFLMTDKLKAKLEEVRSLMGTAGASMSYAELFEAMSDISLETLKAKRFGKKRVAAEKTPQPRVTKNAALPTASVKSVARASNNPRHLSRATKHFVWHRDKGKCTNCGSTRHLNYDHIKPVAKGGLSTRENLRLLCFQCNQRTSTKLFGKIYEKGRNAI